MKNAKALMKAIENLPGDITQTEDKNWQNNITSTLVELNKLSESYSSKNVAKFIQMYRDIIIDEIQKFLVNDHYFTEEFRNDSFSWFQQTLSQLRLSHEDIITEDIEEHVNCFILDQYTARSF